MARFVASARLEGSGRHGPRLFIYKSRNVASYLIAMTLLLQENRIRRAGEKAIPHNWQDHFA
jgi:hypothetical protein